MKPLNNFKVKHLFIGLLTALAQIIVIVFVGIYFIYPAIQVLLQFLDVIYAITDLSLNQSLKELGLLIIYLAFYLMMIFIFFFTKDKLKILESKNGKYRQLLYKLRSSNGVRNGKKLSTLILLIIGSILFLFPMIWMVASSTKTDVEIYKQMGKLSGFLPNIRNISSWFDGYKSVIINYNIWKYALNSIFYAFIILIGNIIVNSLAGYALAKFRFPGKKILMGLILALLIIPIETTMIPLYTIVHNLGFTGTIFAIIVPPLVSVFNIFLFKQFFQSIPKELEEAAEIDGATKFRIYRSIILPLSKPIIATIATFSFIGTWNDYIWPIMVLPAPSGEEWPLYPIQAALNTIQQNPTITTMEVMSSLTLTTIPMVIFYIIMQKYIVEGLGTTGVKF